MATITINGVTTKLPQSHGGYQNDHEWALHMWEDRINSHTVFATINQYGATTIEKELNKLISYCNGHIAQNGCYGYHWEMWLKLVNILHNELALAFFEEDVTKE